MRLNLSTAGLAGASARHPWRTIGIWIGVLIGAIVLMSALLGSALSTDVTTLTNNPESEQADALLSERLGEASSTSGEIVVVTSDTLTVDDAAYRARVEQLFADLTALGDGVIAGGTHYYLTGDESLVSDDRRTTLMPMTIPDGGEDHIERVHEVVRAAAGDFRVLVTGEATLDAEINKAAEEDLAAGEAIGIPVALLVLVLVIGAVAAAFLPLVLAIVAIITGLGATALLGPAIHLPVIVINVMSMMGLAVGIDYALFVVTRYREERAKGREKVDAITMAGATAGRTILLSGMTVAFALCGLLVMPNSSDRAVGAGALLVVLAAVLTSVTLLPALLSLLGDKIDAIRIPVIRRRRAVGTHHPSPSTHQPSGFWDRTSRAVMRRPVVSLILATGLLLAAASSIVDMKQGEIGINGIPDGLMSKDAYLLLQEKFAFGQDLPAVVVIDGQADAAPVQAAVAQLEAAIAADPSFADATVEAHPGANLTILRARLTGDAVSGQALDAVERLRDDYIPRAFAGAPAEVLVTGKTAQLVDLNDVRDTYTPIVFAAVLALSFLLLTVAFRSIVVPIKAIFMNLLSVGAAYGMLVLVFQKGYGADLLGFQQVDVIQTGLPLFQFAILFGLSMDYHVFLLSRIRERFLETGDNAEAVAYGLRSTGRLISGAALIMVAVFGGFALGDLVAMQQMGFGLAAAVLIDATIIRCVLVPASMRLLGSWNWYLPDFLRWLPDLRFEGAEPAPAERAAFGD